jgi:hypothetical protein
MKTSNTSLPSFVVQPLNKISTAMRERAVRNHRPAPGEFWGTFILDDEAGIYFEVKSWHKSEALYRALQTCEKLSLPVSVGTQFVIWGPCDDPTCAGCGKIATFGGEVGGAMKGN